MARILVTGSRDWTDRDLVWSKLSDYWINTSGVFTLVHGACPQGVDKMAAEWGHSMNGGEMGAVVLLEAHPSCGDPLGRNQHMVNMGADICLAFATRWASGTGHCARRARKAGIPTLDFGVSTE